MATCREEERRRKLMKPIKEMMKITSSLKELVKALSCYRSDAVVS